jgi:ESS family glutamate:Na+ symporter
MYGLSALIPGFRSILYGFNFLFGVLIATVISIVVGALHKRNIVHRQYINTFLMTRISGFFFDLMIVAGIAAIRIQRLEAFVGVLVILCVAGAVVTYFYIRLVCRKLFPAYQEEQFLGMFGMLTGTASTGIILLREVDRNLQSPVSDNMVYQNLPAIVFGFPMMLLATMAPVKPYLTFGILVVFFIAMNIILFRSLIFKKRK